MEKEFNLSEKIGRFGDDEFAQIEDIKEFIKRLKDICKAYPGPSNGDCSECYFYNSHEDECEIDKLAGEKLR